MKYKTFSILSFVIIAGLAFCLMSACKEGANERTVREDEPDIFHIQGDDIEMTNAIIEAMKNCEAIS